MARLNRNVSFLKPQRPRAPVTLSSEDIGEQSPEDSYNGADGGLVLSLQLPYLDAQLDLAAERLKEVCVDISDDPKLQRMALNLLIEEAVEKGVSIDEFFEQKEFTIVPDASKLSEIKALAFDGTEGTVDSVLEVAPVSTTIFFMKNAPTRICGDFIVRHNDRIVQNVKDEAGKILDLESARDDDAEANSSRNPDDAIDQEQLDIIMAIIAVLIAWSIEVTLLFLLRQFLSFINFWPLKGLYRALRSLVLTMIRRVSAEVTKRLLKIDDEEEDQVLKAAQFRQIMIIAGNNNFLRGTNLLGLT